MGWQNLGEQPLFQTPWLRLNLAEVELPGGRRLDHYVLRMPPLMLTAILDDQDRVLMLWRHRFIPDSYGWELPSGIADPEEDFAAAAARQALAESGWEPTDLRPLLRLEPSGGLSDSVNHIFWTDRAVHRGEPAAAFESERIEWIALDRVPELISTGAVRAAGTAAALLWLLHRRPDRPDSPLPNTST